MEWLSRTEMVLPKGAVQKLNNSCVWVFGLGGVGSYAAMALVRSGVGKICIVDSDVVDITNINRQLQASHSTIGKKKAFVLADMLRDINPNLDITVFDKYYDESTAGEMDFKGADYVLDAIDSVTSKLLLVRKANEYNVPIISAMGAGNKMDASGFMVDDIYNTSVCPLCRVMRRELKRLGIDSLKVVYSREEPLKPEYQTENIQRKLPPGSVSFVPPVCGFIMAGEAVKHIAGMEKSL